MIGISVKSNVAEVRKRMNKLQRKQLPYATMVALNNSAFQAAKLVKQDIRAALDRPKPFTVNAMRVVDKATKQRLRVVFGFKDFGTGGAPTSYMTNLVEGQARRNKGFEASLKRKGLLNANEFVVPSRTAPLDRYGNLRPGIMQRILANVGGFHDMYQNTPRTYTRQRGRRKAYFMAEIKGVKGIWERSGTRINLILVVVSGAPRYRKQFDFYAIAERRAETLFPRELAMAVDKALATARG